jgi:hypothetical protein
MLCGHLAVIHCRGHQKRNATIAQGNWKADKEAKQVALMRGPAPTVLRAAPQLNGIHGTQHKNRLGLRLRREIFYRTDGEVCDGCIAILESLFNTFVKQFHEGTQHFMSPSSPA